MSITGAVNGLSHVGITVADLDRSVKFYELLGFSECAAGCAPKTTCVN